MTTIRWIPNAAVVRRALIAAALTTYSGGAAAQEAIKTDAQPADTATPSTVEVGIGDVTNGSYKAGEYNGLQSKGAFLIGNLDLRDKTTYTSASALRWRVTGTDLGLETRNIAAELRVQGRFRIFFGYDGLRRNRSDSYQTPYNGAGTDALTLPANWLVPTVAGSSTSNSVTNVVSARGLIPSIATAPYIDIRTTSPTMGVLLKPTAAQIAQVTTAANADLPAFHNVDLFTKRNKYDLGGSYHFTEQWSVDANFQPEHKDGLKPMGTVSRNTGADISTIIPDKIDNDHNQIDTSLNFQGTKLFAQVGYYGSYFKNNVPFMSWQNWASGPGPTAIVNTMSSAPSNNFSQVNGNAVFKLRPSTKLVAIGSYARGTQNDAFLTDATTPVVPVASLNGLVVSRLFNAKLTARPAKKVNFAASYKFDDHDNQTAVHIYQFADAGEAPAANANFPAGPNNPLGAVLAQNANANRPYSRTTNHASVEADYAVASQQWIKGGYDFDRIGRACNGSWITCTDAGTTNENTLRAEWRMTVADNLTARASYAYSARRSPTYNENAFLALVPYANISPASATGGATAVSFMTANGWTGWGPALGYGVTTGNMNLFFPNNNALANATYANNNRISEILGLRRYDMADRNRDKVRTSLNWQPSELLSFQGGFDLDRNDYAHSVYGLQNTKGWAVNVDVTISPNDNLSADVFYTYEHLGSISAGNSYTANSNVSTITNGQPGAIGLSGNSCDTFTTLQQRNNNNKLDPCLNWSSNTLDGVNSVGLGLRKKLSRTDLTGNLIYARARSDNAVMGGSWVNNLLNGPGAAPTSIAAWFIPATPFPTVSSDTVELRLNGIIRIDKRQSLRAAYAYLHLTSADWSYDGMQFGNGTISGVLPTGEQPFNYNVNMVGMSYIFNF